MTSSPSLSGLLSTEKNKNRQSADGHIFISDVHLGAFDDQHNERLEEELMRLVSYCEENGLRITLLGDFFDYWMEYGDEPPPVGKKILQHFREFHERTGSHTLFVTGNHDNWTNGYLPSLGFDMEHEYRIIQVGARSCMVLHGDGLTAPEMKLPRPLVHRFLRNSYFTLIYRAILPRRLGWHLMKTFSGMSRWKQNPERMTENRNKLDRWAANRVTSDPDIHAIIYGHHHSARLEKHNGNISMNCGFFGRDRIAGLHTNGKFKLVKWEADTYDLQTVNTEELSGNE